MAVRTGPAGNDRAVFTGTGEGGGTSIPKYGCGRWARQGSPYTAPARPLAQLCSGREPKSRSTKLTPDVRTYAARQAEAEAGMQEKSKEFREKGGEIYLEELSSS